MGKVYLVILFSTFLLSYSLTKYFTLNTSSISIQATANFLTPKSSHPQVKFFIMSFCPYSNQIESTIQPIFNLLSNQVDFIPHYIFKKIDNLSQYCQSKTADIDICDSYIKKGYYQSLAECQQIIVNNNSNCFDEKNYLKTSSGLLYGSLHGRQEANQNVRELCAWNQVGNNKQNWWKFISNVNNNCTPQNADTCWEEQGKIAGIDTDKVTECFNRDAVDLIEHEISVTNQYNIHVSPTILINDTIYPPENSYIINKQGTLTIGNNLINQDHYRSSESIKKAICSSFDKSPTNCQTKLTDNVDSFSNIVGCQN